MRAAKGIPWSVAPGAGVAVVAPASPVPADAYRAGIELLEARYRLVRVYAPPEQRQTELHYLADADHQRVAALNGALRDPEVCAVFCARGGYGSMRLLRDLDGACLRTRGVPLIGFSDVTALHAWAAIEGVPSVHGPVVSQLASLPTVQQQALFSLIEGHALPRLNGLRALCDGRARGPLWGGNLTVLAALCGTPYFPPLGGRILLLEEVRESPYKIDRTLTQLELARHLDHIVGVVVGALLDCDARQGYPPQMMSAERVLIERLAPLGIPVVCDAPVGHGKDNLALPLGLVAQLDASKGTLTF